MIRKIAVAVATLALSATSVTGMPAKSTKPLATNSSSDFTPARLALGRLIFNDASLSADGKTSCASCHRPDHAYSDGLSVSQGVYARRGTRNTPSLLTTAEPSQPVFWDGRRRRLDKAVIDPFKHPDELGLRSDAEFTARFNTATYRKAFKEAFGSVPTSLSTTLEQVGVALTSFVRSLPRPATAFDQYRNGHDIRAMSRQAIVGLRLFNGKAGCANCHESTGGEARFSDGNFHPTGVGLGEVADNLPTLLERVGKQSLPIDALGREIAKRPDMAALGRFAVTHRVADVGLFRTPSLRYVADTAPYMHDGSIPTLDAAVDQEIYWRGLSGGQSLSLTVSERADIVAFLRALSLPQPVTDIAPKSSKGR